MYGAPKFVSFCLRSVGRVFGSRTRVTTRNCTRGQRSGSTIKSLLIVRVLRLGGLAAPNRSGVVATGRNRCHTSGRATTPPDRVTAEAQPRRLTLRLTLHIEVLVCTRLPGPGAGSGSGCCSAANLKTTSILETWSAIWNQLGKVRSMQRLIAQI